MINCFEMYCRGSKRSLADKQNPNIYINIYIFGFCTSRSVNMERTNVGASIANQMDKDDGEHTVKQAERRFDKDAMPLHSSTSRSAANQSTATGVIVWNPCHIRKL